MLAVKAVVSPSRPADHRIALVCDDQCSKCNKCILSAIPAFTAVLATLGDCKQSLSLIGKADLRLLHPG